MGIFFIAVQIASGLLGWASARTKAIDPFVIPLAGIFCYFIIVPVGPDSPIANARKWFQMPDGTLWITWLTIALFICGRICSELAQNITEDAPEHEDLGWAAFARSKNEYEKQRQYYNPPEQEYSQKKQSFHNYTAPSRPPLSEEETHLETLGLGAGASFKDIKRAYRKLAMKFHPDKAVAGGKSEADIQKAETRMQQINDAYAWLEAQAT